MEHAFQLSSAFTAFQMLFMSLLLAPTVLGRSDLVRAFVRKLTAYVWSFGPMALLIYMLYQVSRLQ